MPPAQLAGAACCWSGLGGIGRAVARLLRRRGSRGVRRRSARPAATHVPGVASYIAATELDEALPAATR